MKITKNILREMIEAEMKEAAPKLGESLNPVDFPIVGGINKTDSDMLDEHLGGGNKVIQRGSRGEEVEALQRAIIKRLKEYSLFHHFKMGAVDGIFGKDTLAAVKALQNIYSITEDGVVGRQTWTAIKTDGKVKAESSNVRSSSDKSVSSEDLAQISVAEVGTNVAEFIATNEFRELIKITYLDSLSKEDFANSFVARYSKDDGTDVSDLKVLQDSFKEKFDIFLDYVFDTADEDDVILNAKTGFKEEIGVDILAIDANKLTRSFLIDYLDGENPNDDNDDVVEYELSRIEDAWDDFTSPTKNEFSLTFELPLLDPSDSTEESFIYTGHEEFIKLANAIMRTWTLDDEPADTEIDSNPLEESLSFDRLSKLAGLLKS